MSYYDDPDFADEYRRRDEEALDAYLQEKEDEQHRCYMQDAQWWAQQLEGLDILRRVGLVQ